MNINPLRSDFGLRLNGEDEKKKTETQPPGSSTNLMDLYTQTLQPLCSDRGYISTKDLSDITHLTLSKGPFQSENLNDFFSRCPLSPPQREQALFFQFLSEEGNYSYLQNMLNTTPIANHVSWLELFELHYKNLLNKLPTEWQKKTLSSWEQTYLRVYLTLLRLQPLYSPLIPSDQAIESKIKLLVELKNYEQSLQKTFPAVAEEWKKTTHLLTQFLMFTNAYDLLTKVPLSFFPNSEKLNPTTPTDFPQAVKNLQRLCQFLIHSVIDPKEDMRQDLTIKLAIPVRLGIQSAFSQISDRLKDKGTATDWQDMAKFIKKHRIALTDLSKLFPSSNTVSEAQRKIDLLLSLALWRIDELLAIVQTFSAFTQKNYTPPSLHLKRAIIQLNLLIEQSASEEKLQLPEKIKGISQDLQTYFKKVESLFHSVVQDYPADTLYEIFFQELQSDLTPYLQDFIKKIKEILNKPTASLKNEPLIKNYSFFTQIFFLYRDIQDYLGGQTPFEEMPPYTYIDFLALGSDAPKLTPLKNEELSTKVENKEPSSKAKATKRKKKKKKALHSQTNQTGSQSEPITAKEESPPQLSLHTPPEITPPLIPQANQQQFPSESLPQKELKDQGDSTVRKDTTPAAKNFKPSIPPNPIRVPPIADRQQSSRSQPYLTFSQPSPQTGSLPTSLEEVKKQVKEDLQSVGFKRKDLLKYLERTLEEKRIGGNRHVKVGPIPMPGSREIKPGTFHQIAHQVAELQWKNLQKRQQ